MPVVYRWCFLMEIFLALDFYLGPSRKVGAQSLIDVVVGVLFFLPAAFLWWKISTESK